MGIFCGTCQEHVVGDIDTYRKHLKDRKHLPPFQCFEEACKGTTYSLAASLIRHIQSKHAHAAAGHSAASSADQSVHVRIECTNSNDDGDVHMPSAPNSDSNSDNDDDNVESETLTDLNLVFERAIAQLCMNLWRRGNVPGVAIELVVEETEKLILDVTNAVSSTYMSVSIIKTLTAILNDPILYKLIHEERPSSDGHLRSFLDGTLAAEHPLIRKYPHTLRLVFNGDEVELVNKVGTKTFLHKLMGIYYLLQNLPPEENARLRAIHVAAYGYSADFEGEEDVDCILGEVCRELEMLQSEEGVLISVNDRPYPLHAVAIALAADTEGAHKLLGFLPASSNCFCRWCTVKRAEMHQNIFAMGEERTRALHEDHIKEVEARGKPAQKSTGVKRDCILRPVFTKLSQFPQLGVFDSMHDILKGIAAMEIKLSLHEICVKRKLIDVKLFNSRITSFPLAPQDVKNRPSANFTDDSLASQGSYTLSQTAAQTWCLLRMFVFLVSPNVPLDNSHIRLISLLKRLSEVIFSGDVTEENIEMLENLIYEHHRLFFELYPPPNVENNPDQNQGGTEDEENDWNENLVDDPQDVNPAQEDTVNEEENSGEPPNKKIKKKKKVIRPINKHHQILHYPSMIRRYGPAQNYWCMRFEAKHKIASQYASTSGNFINVASSVADIHQISHAADLKEIVCPVREELKTLSKSSKMTVSRHPYCQQLEALGLDRSCVVLLPEHAMMGGFHFKADLYVVMPTRENDLPVFGLIKEVVVWENRVIIMVEEQKTLNYNELFGAFACQPRSNNEERRAIFTSSLPSKQSLSAWRRPDVPGLQYLSCRTVIN
ncbi:hypothetical protein FOCC_FOCC015197 [Frankliniella occidentalis]|nr:hypothetical protein FOCC_FOCC015197 [Frankliniella occidentalis]